MSEPIQTIAKSMEVGGATAAVAPWILSTLGWIDHHYQAAMVIIGLIGVVISAIGLVLNAAVTWYFKAREDQRQLAEHNLRIAAREGRRFMSEDPVEQEKRDAA